MCTFLSPNILLSGIRYQLRKQLCSFENERCISFSYTIWFMISEKNITRKGTFLHHGACMHQKSQRGIWKILLALKLPLCGLLIWTRIELIEGDRSFKTFLNENYVIALDSRFLFTQKNVNYGIAEHDIDSTYRDRHSWNVQQIWWIPCNLGRWCWLHSDNL